MITRYFDPTKDSLDDLAQFNEWSEDWRQWWTSALRRRFLEPRNVIVVEHEGQLIGAALLLDAGFPFLVVEGAFMSPEHRGRGTLRYFLDAIDEEARKRGITLVFSHVPPHIGHAMQRFGYAPMNENEYRLIGRVVPPKEA